MSVSLVTPNNQTHLEPVLIDLDSSAGDPVSLMSAAHHASNLRGWTRQEFVDLRVSMMMKDYVNLIFEMDNALTGAFHFVTTNKRLYDALLGAGCFGPEVSRANILNDFIQCAVYKLHIVFAYAVYKLHIEH